MPGPPSTPRRPACFMIHDLADKLLVYECRHIDESFIKKLNKKMHSLSMMQRVIMTWIESLQLDSEYAERIWKWWKPRKEKYPYHGVAVRLIAYAQLSSCSVERIVKVTSDTMKEDMCEVRLLLQVNGDLDEMHNALVVNYGEE
eukprot:scaffold11265_cov308-Chaetoceros_neogracile.AAC.2